MSWWNAPPPTCRHEAGVDRLVGAERVSAPKCDAIPVQTPALAGFSDSRINAPPARDRGTLCRDIDDTRRGAGWRSRLLIMMLGFSGASAAFAADAPPLILEHLTTADGLPQATVMTTLQDSQGFVWLGTEDGLVRYDGHELYRYALLAHRARARFPATSSGRSSRTRTTTCGSRSRTAASRAGTARTDTFTVYRHDRERIRIARERQRARRARRRARPRLGRAPAMPASTSSIPRRAASSICATTPNAPASLSSDHIFTLALDRAGDVWIGTDAGSTAGQRARAR